MNRNYYLAEKLALSRSRKKDKEISEEEINEAIKHIDNANKLNIKVVTDDDYDFPTLLKNYDAHPLLLFYLGDIGRLNQIKNSIAVVGSRNCTYQGKDDIANMVKGFKGEDVAIISGLARGIDGAAHKAALVNSIFTCAVVASGVDVCYPPEHRAMYKEIINSGVVISENPPYERPKRQYFPARNRIIAGLSELILVGEAGIKSGALITAEFGLDAGRQVVTIPQSINSIYGAGCNELLKAGAPCITCPEDIKLALGMDVSKCMKDAVDISMLPEEEKTIYSIIAHSKGLNEDQIFERSLLDISVFKSSLIRLQLHNFIRMREDGIFLAEL